MQEMERQQYGGAHAQKLPATPEKNPTNEAKESIATPPSSPDLLECSACHEMLGATDFSKTQLKRVTRRCKSCARALKAIRTIMRTISLREFSTRKA